MNQAFPDIQRVAVIGLGNMGAGMALSLQRAGFSVSGFDPSPAAREALAGKGITLLDSLAELVAQAQVIVLSLPTSDIIERVVLGEEGIVAHVSQPTILLDTSTADPTSTRRIAEALANSALTLVDGPVSGGPKAAHGGNMTMLLGGDEAVLAHLSPVLDALTGKRVRVGEVGAGHSAKLLNNLLCGMHLLAAGEAMRIARGAGLEPEEILRGINAGSGRSGVTEVNYPTWILNEAFDSGFTMKLMRKDLRLAADLIVRSGAGVPLAEEALRLWQTSLPAIADTDDFNCIVNYEEQP